MHGPRIRQDRAIPRHRSGKRFEPLAHIAEVGRGLQLQFGFGKSGNRLAQIRADARARFVESRSPTRQLAGSLFGLRKGVARFADRMLRISPCLTRSDLGRGFLAHRAFRGDSAASAVRTFSVAATASASSSTSRFFCASRCAAAVGASALAVKPSQRQSAPSRLTSRWPGLSSICNRRPSAASTMPIWARRRASCRGALHDGCQAAHAFRQSRIAGGKVGFRPMHGRAAIERGVEILAKCCAERRFKAAFNADLLQHRGKQVAGRGIDYLGERARLGLDAGEFGSGLLQRRTGGAFRGASVLHRRFSRICRRLGAFQRCLGRFGEELFLHRIGQAGNPPGDIGGFAIDICKLAFEALPPFRRLTQCALQLGAHSRSVGALRRQLGKRCFAERKHGRSFFERGSRRRLALHRRGIFQIERGFFGIQPLQDVRIVADHLLLAGDVGVELLHAPAQFGVAGAHARRLFLDLRLGDRQALEGRGSGGFRLAQFGHAMRADRLLLGGVHLRCRALADDRSCRSERRLRLRFVRLGQRPAQVQQRCFRLADIG